MADSAEATADLGDVTLRYTVHGHGGPWVTLLHGGMVGSASLEGQARRLSAGARVLTFDQRGYGGSSRPATGFTVAQFAHDLERLWDALDIPQSTLVGFSMGGFVAIETALRAPERVAALLLVGTAAGLPETMRQGFTRRAEELERTGTEEQREALLDRGFSEGFRTAHPDFMARYREAAAATDPRCLAATFRALAQFDRTADVSAISCPVLVVCGEDDAAIPVEHSRALHAAIAGSRLETLPGVGHTVFAEEPDTFTELVRRNLTQKQE